MNGVEQRVIPMRLRFNFTLIIPLVFLALISACTKEVTPEEPVTTYDFSITSPKENQLLSSSSAFVMITINEKAPVAKMEIYLDDSSTPLQTLPSAPWLFSLNLAALNDGTHKIIVKAFDPTGKEIASDLRHFNKQVSTNAQDERMLLVENFTNAGCIPCKAAEEGYERIIANEAIGSRTVTILYHVFWPDPKDPFYLANPVPVQKRIFYYDTVKSAPHARFNGATKGDNTLDYFKDWQKQMLDELIRPPDCEIRLSKDIPGNGGTITATIKSYAQTFAGDLRLYIVVIEDSLNYPGSNGILMHRFVMRDMITGGSGEPITLVSGQQQTITKQVTLNPAWVRKNLSAIVFVQTNSGKLVLQTAKIKLE